MLGGRIGTSFFPFSFFFIFSLRSGNILDGECGNRVRSFVCISFTKNHYFLCRKHKNVPKHKNNHRHADPSTSCFSFRYFAMWRILTRSRFLLPPQPTEEMLVFAEETPKVGGHRGGNWNHFWPCVPCVVLLLTRQFWAISGHFWRVRM